MTPERRSAAIFIPFSLLRGMEGGCGAHCSRRSSEAVAATEVLAFPITHHSVLLDAAAPERYLLFCKDYALIEQKNC